MANDPLLQPYRLKRLLMRNRLMSTALATGKAQERRTNMKF